MKQFDGFIPSKKLFDKRVNQNFKLYEKKKFKFWKYKFFDIKNGKAENPHADTLSKSINDMRGSIPLGQLAIYTQHGADAFMNKDGEYIATELKTIEIDEQKLIVGENNVIYYENKKLKRSTLENHYSIGFVVTNEELRKSKNRPTFVVLRTKETGETIDAFYLPGDVIYRELLKGDIDVASKSVSLKVFLTEGSKEPVLIPHVGWEKWKQRILNNNKYLIRPMTQKNLKQKYANERLELRKTITDIKENLKELSSKVSKVNRLAGTTYTQIKKEREKIENTDEQIVKLNVRKAVINSIIELKAKRTELLDEMLSTVKTNFNNFEDRMMTTYEKIDKSFLSEESDLEANAKLRKLIQNN